MMKSKKAAGVVFGILLAAALLYYVLSKAGIGNIKEYIKNISYVRILAAIGLYTIDMFLRSYRWREILLDNNVEITMADAFLAYNLGNSLNIIVPAKIGDVARSYYLKKKYYKSYMSTLPAVVMDRFFDVVGVYVIMVVTCLYIITQVTLPGWFMDLMIAGVIGLLAAFIVFYYLTAKEERVNSIKNEKIKKLILSLIENLNGSVKNKKKFIKLTIYSMLMWFLEGMVAYTVFLSIHCPVNPVVAIFANMTATLTKIVPVTPGGIGVFEGTMVIILSLFGIPSSIGGVVSTLNHFIMNIYTIVIGIYVILANEIKISNISRGKAGEV
jgi:uncharacterized protein (TIRG00374 family)